MKHKIIEKNPAGFSLVELSFVVLIIGLLIAAVTGGKKLIALSNLTKARTSTLSAPLTSIDDLALWLETTSKNSFTTAQPTDGTLIDSWRDINTQSPLKKDMTAAGAARPTYTENAINGLPALSFNGTTQYLSRANTYGYEFARNNQVTIFIVNKSISPTQNSAVFSWENVSSNRLTLHLPWVDNNFYFDFGTCCSTAGRISTAMPANFMNSWTITSVIRRDDNSGDISVNNTAIVSNPSTFNSPLNTTLSSTFWVGSQAGINQHKGLIAELIIYDRALSASERQRIMEYLSKKWNITIS